MVRCLRPRPISAPALAVLALLACTERQGVPPAPPSAPASTASAPAAATSAPAAPRDPVAAIRTALEAQRAPPIAAVALLAYNAQGTVEIPPALQPIIGALGPTKTVTGEDGREMELTRLSPGRRWDRATVLSLDAGDTYFAEVASALRKAGFGGPEPAPEAPLGPLTLRSSDGREVQFRVRVEPGQPSKLELRLNGPESPAPRFGPTSPEMPAPLPALVKGFTLLGYEWGHFHAVVPGGRDTDASRLAFIGRAATADARTRFLAEVGAPLAAAGYTPRAGHEGVYERTATRETLVLKPSVEVSTDLIFSHQRHWRR